MVDGLPPGVVAQPGEPAIHRPIRREAVGHQTPCDAAAQHVADRVDDLAHRLGPLAAAIGFAGQERVQDPPFGISQVASIVWLGPAMLPPGDRGPH